VATIQNYYGGLWTFVGTDYEPFVVGFYMYFVRVFCYVDIKSDSPSRTFQLCRTRHPESTGCEVSKDD
jgi:hypothetical protein